MVVTSVRGLKNREKIYQMLDEFESLKENYNERHTVERCFAGEDTYRKLVTRYEKLQDTYFHGVQIHGIFDD